MTGVQTCALPISLRKDMARVKRGVQAKARHKKVLKQAKGYRGARSRTYKVAKQAVMRAGQYAYRDRRVKKRVFRSLWIVRINAAARENGLTDRHRQINNTLSSATVYTFHPVGRNLLVDNAIPLAAVKSVEFKTSPT